MLQAKKDYIEAHEDKDRFECYPLHREVLDLMQANTFTKPTRVQAETMPITLQKNLKELCLIVYSENGSGKTLSFVIPILNSLQLIPDVDLKKEVSKVRGQQFVYRPQAIIVVPTRTLYDQILKQLQAFASHYSEQLKWPLKIGSLYQKVSNPGHILIGLPVKIAEGLNMNLIDTSQLKWLVFDEADQIKNDFYDSFDHILKYVSNKKLQTNVSGG